MDRQGMFNTGGYNGRYLRFEWWTGTPDIANNATPIGWKVVGAGNAPSSWYYLKNTVVVINGITVFNQSGALQLYNNTVVASGNVSIPHNSDGSKSFSASITGDIYNYGSNNASGSGSWTLPPIPRAAIITKAVSFNDENIPDMYYSNPAGNSVNSLQACICSPDGVSIWANYRDIPKTGTKYTWNLTPAERTAMRSACSNSDSMPFKYVLKTIIGSNTEYSQEHRTFTIVNAQPTINSFDAYDSNGTTVGLTGNNHILVKGFSNLTLSMNPQAHKGARIVDNQVYTHGSWRNGTSTTINGATDGSCQFYTKDSRGKTCYQNKNLSVVPYFVPSCNLSGNATLAPNNKANVSINITGSCFTGSFGKVENTRDVQYRYRIDNGGWSGWVKLNSNGSNNNYNVSSSNICSMNQSSTCVVQAWFRDKLSGIYSTEISIKALPVFNWSKSAINTNVPIWYQGSNKTYSVFGKICGGVSTSIDGIGSCLITINYNNVAKIDFDFKIRNIEPDQKNSKYDWGLDIELIRIIDKNVPIITPKTGGYIRYLKTDGTTNEDREGWGGCTQGIGGRFWLPARVYSLHDGDNYGSIGGWQSWLFSSGDRIFGTVYGIANMG